MARTKKPARAIDLYAGVGGWSLGLKLAGIDVVKSYDIWEPANITNKLNLRSNATTLNIRNLPTGDLPSHVNVVVGSPPCTQFSFSNRGGYGDIDDGFEDVAAFLRIIDHLRPDYWAMENVPRFAKLFKAELQTGGRLATFRHLPMQVEVFNLEDFGLPQRRNRCIVGNINFGLLRSYSERMQRRTLGDVITSLSKSRIVDPVYGASTSRRELTDHVPEVALNDEETRINRALKQFHPVYNSMSFPDRVDRAARTLTATCTRVSRESIIIEHPEQPGTYRRLTIRERASLQGFPVQYQFFGKTHAEKLKMVGNAMPPLFAWLIAESMKGVAAENLRHPSEIVSAFDPPLQSAKATPTERAGRVYRADRNFCFAVPRLRLKSGVRFELHNTHVGDSCTWSVRFKFGTPSSIHTLNLTPALYGVVHGGLSKALKLKIGKSINDLRKSVEDLDLENLQGVWNRRSTGKTHPFDLLDLIDQFGNEIATLLCGNEDLAEELLLEGIKSQFGRKTSTLAGLPKLTRYPTIIASGIIAGSTANFVLNGLPARGRALKKA